MSDATLEEQLAARDFSRGGQSVDPYDPPSARLMAYALCWAAEWGDLGQPPAVDACYIDGVKETIGHMLACWLVQSAGWDCCETGVARNLIPWDEAPRWNVDQWKVFLIKTAKENR